jgi:phosphate transport system protein
MAEQHTVKAFDNEITQLRGLIAEMGGLAEISIARAMDALISHDEELAKTVVAGDAKLSASSHCVRQWQTICAM